MPIYSEVIDDKSILQILQDKYNKVLLIGCGACMNESLAYKYDMPITKDSSSVPFATACELARLAKLLSENGFIAETKFYNDIDGFFAWEMYQLTNTLLTMLHHSISF